MTKECSLLTLPACQLRDPYRGAYPHLAYDPAYGQIPPHAGLPFGYDYAVPPFAGGPHHPLAAQGRTVASVPHGHGGRADPFSAYRMPNSTALPPSAMPQHYQMMAAGNGASGGAHRPTLDDHLTAVPHGMHGRSATLPKHANAMHTGFPMKQDGRARQMYFPVGYAGV